MKITESRKTVFLKILSETGSVAAAIKAASPHLDSERSGKTSWYDLRRRDPAFAEAWDSAQDEALAMVEAELVRRAMNPPRSPVTNRQGDVVGEKEDRFSSDKLLLRIASRLAPEHWAERSRKDINVQGKIEHQANLMLAPSDLLLLPKADQQKLLELLDTIEARKNGASDPMMIKEADDVESE